MYTYIIVSFSIVISQFIYCSCLTLLCPIIILTMNCEDRYRRLLSANHIFGDALVFALIGWPHVRYH